MAELITHGVRDAALDEKDPVGSTQWFRRPGEGNREVFCSGIWKISPEEAPDGFDVVAPADEVIYLLEGVIRITPEEGEPFTLTAGSSASFNKGSVAKWEIIEPVVEFFSYS